VRRVRFDFRIRRLTMNQEPVTEWLTAQEAAEHLRVRARTLLLWARQGRVKGYQLSGVTRHVWRFRRADLDATLEPPSVRPEERMER
jgi:excisionase family DNA binding protein